MGNVEFTIERKHALIRIKRGDYLLLSNDGKTLWRIATYTEDGSAYTSDNRALTGEFWGTWRYRKPVVKGEAVLIDDWNDFEMDDMLIRTRKEAIEMVLSRD